MHHSLDTKHGLLVKSGSFWGENLTEASRQHARRLVHAAGTRLPDLQLDSCVDWVDGASSPWAYNVVRTFDEADIRTLHDIDAGRWVTMLDDLIITFRANRQTAVAEGVLFTDDTGTILSAENGDYLIWPGVTPESESSCPPDYRPVWLLPWTEDLEPYALQGPDGPLLAGIDFQKKGNVLVCFRSPVILFPDRTIVMLTGRQAHRSLHSFTLKLDDTFGPTNEIMDWVRDKQSLLSFQLALARSCNRVICPDDVVITSVTVLPEGTKYGFDGGEMLVPYAHTQLQRDQHVPKNTIIGGGISVFKPGPGVWWRSVNWTSGLSLDGLCQVQGLTVPDMPISLTDDKAYPVPDGSAQAIAAYHTCLALGEKVSGKLLTTIGTPGSRVNGIDYYFTNLLGSRALLVQLDLDPDSVRRIRAFIKREQPLGVVIVRSTE